MSSFNLIYEHNLEGKLVNIIDSKWSPGMFRKDGKLFKIDKDPRRIKIPEDPKPVNQVRPESPSTQKPVITNGYVYGKAKKRSLRIKTKRCKKSYEEKQILDHLTQRRMVLNIKDGVKKYWLVDPSIKKSLRGFCYFNKGNTFSQFLFIPSKKQIYVWNKGSHPTPKTSPEEADFLIQY